jgi:uncharacterized membrane protein YgcG
MTDDELLASLAAAFAAPASAEPPAAGLRDLHRAVDVTSTQRVPLRRPARRVLPIAVATAVAAACVAVVLVIATLPRIGRETATQVTVTVTSPAFGEVTIQRRALERALTEGDVADVATSAARLRIALPNVTPGELDPIRAEIVHLLARADALLDRRRGGNDDLPPSSQSMTSAPQPTSAAAVPPSPTGTSSQASSPAAPLPTTATPAAPSTTLPDGADDDNSGPGGGDDADGHSGPGGGGAVAPVVPDDDNSGPGGAGHSGDSGDSGSGSGSGSGSSGSGSSGSG